jgi:integrase
LRSPEAIVAGHAPLRPLLVKELREIIAGRGLWILLLLMCPLIGYSFFQAVSLYAESSAAGLQSPVLAVSLSPFDGALVPSFGASYVAVTLLFPFVAIRVLGQEKESGTLRLLVPLPYRTSTLIAAKLAPILVALVLVTLQGIKQLYSQNRSEVIWTDTEIEQLKRNCTPEIAHAFDLAVHTGLRLGDLLRLSWSHVQGDGIAFPTGKSKHRRVATIPLYDDLRTVLAGIPKRSTVILTNSRHRPWTRDGFGSSFNKAKIAAGLADRDLHFHHLRGTAATRSILLTCRSVQLPRSWDGRSSM